MGRELKKGGWGFWGMTGKKQEKCTKIKGDSRERNKRTRKRKLEIEGELEIIRDWASRIVLPVLLS